MKPVVYIDDEPMLCRAIRMVFATAEIPVETFSDPSEALRFLAEHEVAVVICDYRMPGLSGLDVLEKLPHRVPYYLVTGELEIATPEGVIEVLEKPFPLQRLVEIARKYLD